MGLSNSLAQSEYDQLSMVFRRFLIDPPDNFLCNRIKDMPHLLNPRLNILFGYGLKAPEILENGDIIIRRVQPNEKSPSARDKKEKGR